jgi:hypothetical protein
MSQALSQRPFGFGLNVDIASVNSRVYWHVPVRLARTIVQLPARWFTRFDDAIAARAAIDPSPAITSHPTAQLQCGDLVDVDGAAGTLAWIHDNGDVRVRLAEAPEHAEYYPIAAIRRAVQTGKPKAVWDEVGAAAAHRAARDLGGRLATLRDGAISLVLRERSGPAVGVIACARPVRPALDDGLTLEVRGIVAGEDGATGARMLRQMSQLASVRGYRRLVLRDRSGAMADGWTSMNSMGHRGWWCRVLSVAECR